MIIELEALLQKEDMFMILYQQDPWSQGLEGVVLPNQPPRDVRREVYPWSQVLVGVVLPDQPPRGMNAI